MPPPKRDTNTGPGSGNGPTGPILTASERNGLYAARRFIGTSVEQKLGIQYSLRRLLPGSRSSPRKTRSWRSTRSGSSPGSPACRTVPRVRGLRWSTTTRTPTRSPQPARWDEKRDGFVDAGRQAAQPGQHRAVQFHQVNAWAILQHALDFYESGFGLGRRIPWGFDGSRLIVVPHAGPGENAYYDRTSKSLQFYYFDRGEERIYTCLSTDIIHHEFGHAVLDGIRPLYFEACRRKRRLSMNSSAI